MILWGKVVDGNKQQFLNFLPEPQGQGSFLPILLLDNWFFVGNIFIGLTNCLSNSDRVATSFAVKILPSLISIYFFTSVVSVFSVTIFIFSQ